MKAIIPVAGAGTRLRPLTYTQPKPLIPIAGRPIISFIIDKLSDVGIRDFIFIIGYLGEKIKNYVEKTYPELNKVFVTQQERLGSAHAVWVAKEHLAPKDEVFIFFGDTIVDADFQSMVNHPNSCLGVKKVQSPWDFGIVEYGRDGSIRSLAEKPRIPKSDLALVGIYKIREVAEMLDAIEYNMVNDVKTNGEYPLTDALMTMLNNGVHLETITVDNWFNCGVREILLETNATFLDRAGYASTNLPAFDQSILIHPVSIGENCQIVNSIVGPHVTIGNNTVIQNAIVRNSIIGNFASIKEINLEKSIVGHDASIVGIRQSLNIGDNTEIDFSL